MTIVKDAPRPTSSHRLSVSSAASSLPTRQSYSRSHSNSTSFGSYNTTHRVTRRKSTTLNPATSAAAISAAVNIGNDGEADARKAGSRRSMSSRTALGSLNPGSYPTPPSSLPHHVSVPSAIQYGRKSSSNGSAIIDGPPLASLSIKGDKDRTRRASESTLARKKLAAGELKCETCGKGYKHSSCLTKHLWEHTPEWSITSKLLISKHQQVQLLEAASVLVAMNSEAAEAGKTSDSDHSSASPAASGSSDPQDDDISSAETTPPPHAEAAYRRQKRDSNASSSFSRSYQSTLSTSEGAAFDYHRHWSTSSNRALAESYPDEDQADLAAAVGLLSCSYGTPQSGPAFLSANVPPVPPLPARYQGHSDSFRPAASSQNPHFRSGEDVDMAEESSSEEDDEQPRYHQEASTRADDDDGIFGNMEE